MTSYVTSLTYQNSCYLLMIPISHKDPNCLFCLANTEFTSKQYQANNTKQTIPSKQYQANKLSLNLKKTFFMVFKTRQRKSIIEGPLIIEDKQIEQVSQISFLGVILAKYLAWSYVSNLKRPILLQKRIVRSIEKAD